MTGETQWHCDANVGQSACDRWTEKPASELRTRLRRERTRSSYGATEKIEHVLLRHAIEDEGEAARVER